MNLFSQSKLTLKLKKQNSDSTLSTDPTNKSQNLTPSSAVKSEYNNALNNSVLSENDSFVEILHTIRPQDEKVTMSQNIFKTSTVQNVSDVITESKECPVCLQMFDTKHFINHVKSCGISHNLSSEVLIKAVDLQERQAAEREALGLPKLSKSKDVKIKKKCNKQTKLKIGSDSNFDLAVAMSMSLQESKEAEIIKESENLLEAGLETEAIEKRKTLENFGFISNQPIKSKSKNFYKTNSLLFKQTQEDRQKRITEKVAMILIDCDTHTLSSETSLNDCPDIKLRSNYLNKIRNTECKLWKKTLLEENNLFEFYVKNISKFLSPIEENGLHNSVLFSAHQNSLKQESNITDQNVINTSFAVLDDSKVHNKDFTHHNIVENKTIPEYSSRWKSMLGNQFMSDVTIFSKDEHEIPAHILVFHVQCPDILNDIIKEESDTCKSKKMIMWFEYSYEACMAFLELIYSGQEQLISPEYKKDYLQLVTRYNVQIVINYDDEKHGWFPVEHDQVLKRKSSESYSIDSKRFKAHSPDMFLMDDTNEEISNVNSNFLGITVNDEKSLSVFKTKQWLKNCNLSQHHNSSFTENSEINILPQTNSPLQSPAHSFHSTSTVHIQLTPTSNQIDYITDFENNDEHNSPLLDIRSASPKSLSTDESSVKAILMLNNIKKIPIDLKSSSNIISTLNNSRKEPELITIISDSDNESIDMVLSRYNSPLRDRNINLLNENKCTPFLASVNKKKNYFPFNSVNKSNDISVIELNDSSLDSIHSVNTNILHQKHCNSKLDNVLINKSTISTPRTTTLIELNDERIVVPSETRFTNSSNIQMESSSNNNFIDLINDSSSDSIAVIDKIKNNSSMASLSLNNTQQSCQNSSTPISNVSRKISSPIHDSLTTQFETNNCVSNVSPFKEGNAWSKYAFPITVGDYYANINTKTNEDLCSTNVSSNASLPKYSNSKLLSAEKLFQYNDKSPTILNTISCTQINNVENNDNIINSIYSNEKNVLDKPNSDFEPLENIISKKDVILPSNNYVDSLGNIKDAVDLTTICASHTSFKPYSSQVETVQLPTTSEISTSNEKDEENDKSTFEQIIDDPWMDYNDWPPVNISPQNCSPVLLEKNSMVNDSEILTSPKTVMINMDLQTSPPIIANNIDIVNHQMKNAVTPNKYGSRISTPKSLRRVQSESVIGTNEQITPLPNYSTMKTPDLRKEFDRYGLKDLGRRKGKLILRHIYDIIHPIHDSEEAKCTGESEQYSDSSNSSEPEISYYEAGAYDELETFSQTNLSSKTSVDMGFKDLLRANAELHKKILCYEPIWIEELKEDLKQYNVNISMQKLMTFLDDKCVSFRSKSLNDQRKKSVAKKSTKRKKLF
uniref:Structure-specific endonuclease subunit SLX4 n=1 Tax=Schizaphis graminum TaxID=13262 RepID=A0A2S2N7L0_SCHGA